MKVQKTLSMLATAVMLGGAAPVFADHDDNKSPAQIAFQRHLAEQDPAANGSGHLATAPAFGGNFRHGGLTPSELNTIWNFESEVNYRNFVSQLSAKYGVSPAAIERMADRQLAAEERRFFESPYRGHRSDRHRIGSRF